MHGRRSRRFFLSLGAATLAAAPGCTRTFYREQADRDVAAVLTQKNISPQWAIGNWYAYPHPKARFGDPSRPDRPPYPPDDFAARILSPNPQHPTKLSGAGRHEGYGYLELLGAWDAENQATDAAAADNPAVPPVLPPAPTPEKVGPPKPVNPVGVRGPGGSPRESVVTPIAQVAVVAPVTGPHPPGIVEITRSSAAVPAPATPTIARGPVITEVRQAGGEIRPAGGSAPDSKVTPAVVVVPDPMPVRLPEIPLAPGAKAAQPPVPRKDGEPAPLPGSVAPGAAGPPAPGREPYVPGPTPLTGDQANAYLRALQVNDSGFLVQLNQAVELGVLTAREFQDRREDLYLAALPVTLERFQFAAQAFLTEQVVRSSVGGGFSGGPSNTWANSVTGGLTKLFPTGATLLARFANQVVIDLSGSKPITSVSNFTLNVLQPLLRGGGYAVTLEPLTQSERNLLYGVRSYARFRKLFYVAIAAGGGITNNPYSFQGLSVNLGRGIGGNLTAPSVGFLPLLLQSAVLGNQRENIARLESLLQQYRAYAENGQIPDLQVSQVEQSLLSNRTQLLGTSNFNNAGANGIRGYLDSLDNFKLQLGVPLTTGLKLEAGPLRPINQQLQRFEDLYTQSRGLEEEARKLADPALNVNLFRPGWRQILTGSPLVRGTQFAQVIAGQWAAWDRSKLTDEALRKQVSKYADDRRRLLEKRADRLAQTPPVADPPDEVRALAQVTREIELGEFEQAVRFYESQPWLKEKGSLRATIQAGAFRDVLSTFYQVVLEARTERLEAIRRQWPRLPGLPVDGIDLLEVPLDDAYTAGIQSALTHRLDLMNARGQVVDAWRQIKVQANTLQGVFNVQYNLQGSTPPLGSNPLAFSTPQTQNQLTFNFQLPLVRRAERNNYRAALIGYQRQRRTLMAFEDNIANDIRADIRVARTVAELYRIQQRLIEIGYFQVDSARETQFAPLAAGAQPDPANSAALTNQVLQAQSGLVNAQNTLYTIWVNYLSARMTLYLDLELMQLDERGVWCDELVPGNDRPGRPGLELAPRGEPVLAPRAAGEPR